MKYIFALALTYSLPAFGGRPMTPQEISTYKPVMTSQEISVYLKSPQAGACTNKKAGEACTFNVKGVTGSGICTVEKIEQQGKGATEVMICLKQQTGS